MTSKTYQTCRNQLPELQTIQKQYQIRFLEPPYAAAISSQRAYTKSTIIPVKTNPNNPVNEWACLMKVQNAKVIQLEEQRD
jgi:hypothetical protein